MATIPAFDADGLLPPNDYELSFEELRNSILAVGPGRAEWDSAWRLQLIGNLETLTQQLWQVGVSEVFADGPLPKTRTTPTTSTVISPAHWTR